MISSTPKPKSKRSKPKGTPSSSFKQQSLLNFFSKTPQKSPIGNISSNKIQTGKKDEKRDPPSIKPSLKRVTASKSNTLPTIVQRVTQADDMDTSLDIGMLSSALLK